MLMIRFQRTGRINNPSFRIVLLEKGRSAKTGDIVEQLGSYNPKSKELILNAERVKEWISKGAQPTDSIRNLLITKSILEGKKVNVLPKKSPIKKEEPVVQAVTAETAPTESEIAQEAIPSEEESKETAEEEKSLVEETTPATEEVA